MDDLLLPESTQECIRTFEQALEKCKRGEILECLVMTKNIDETMTFRCSETFNFYTFLGFIEQYKFDMLYSKRENCENPNRY